MIAPAHSGEAVTLKIEAQLGAWRGEKSE